MLFLGGSKDIDSEAHALYQVLELNKHLSREHDLDRLLESILDAAIELTGSERGLVLLHTQTDARDHLEVRASRELGARSDADPHLQFSKSIAESVDLDGEPIITIDAMDDDRFNEFLSIHELKLKSVACVPVRYRGRGLGVLYLENRLKRGRFGKKDIRVLAAFADQAAIAIAQAQLLEEARKKQAELEEMRNALKGAYEQQTEDLENKEINLRLAEDKLKRMYDRLEGQGDYYGIIAGSGSMSRVVALADRVKDLDVPVAIVGESGTGKDLLARVLHEHGLRGTGPYIVLACGSIPESLVEATLFGSVKGAFSGATQDKIGTLEAAHRGTLYLDEIGDMSARIQVDLLRVLQEGRFTPLGAAHPIDVDFRLIVSSTTPLDDLVAAGRLRKDLYYRLQVVTIELPPLRERNEDIIPLARLILEREAYKLKEQRRSLSKEAAQMLLGREWPGNVRELEHLLRRALIINPGLGSITAEDLLEDRQLAQNALTAVPPSRVRIRGHQQEDEKRRIVEALEQCKWNRSKAALKLGIPRRTFYRRLEKLGLLKKK